jgi:ACS family hexuronate transporter-like MFS transporter
VGTGLFESGRESGSLHASEGGAISRRRAWLVAAVATLAMSVSYADRQVVAAIGASVRKALGIDAAQFGLMAAAFSLSYLVCAPLAGAVLDRVGARRGLVFAVLAWSAVSAAHALVPSFAALFALRVLLGTAEAPSFPAAAQTVQRSLPDRDRSAAFGLLFTGSSLGAAVAAPLAIALDVRYGWRVAFLVASAAGLLWLPAWVLVTRPARVRERLATPRAPDRPAQGAPPSHGSPWRDPAAWRAVLLVFASAPGMMFMFVWMPQYFELGRGIPKAVLPQYVWVPPLAADAGMIGFGALASAIDRRTPVARLHWDLVLAAAALETALVLLPQTRGAWAAVACIGVSAAGGGGLYTLLTADLMARVDPSRVSTAGGICAAAQALVYVAFNPLVGRWVDVTHSFDGSIVFLGALALPGALAWTAWGTAQSRLAPRAARTAPGRD